MPWGVSCNKMCPTLPAQLFYSDINSSPHTKSTAALKVEKQWPPLLCLYVLYEAAMQKNGATFKPQQAVQIEQQDGVSEPR